MSETNDITFNSSQEIILFSSQTLELDDDFQPSTQVINHVNTQEASNASDYFDNLRESQVIATDGSDSSPEQSNETKNHEFTDVSVDSFRESEPMVEKKKRGRKRKIRTEEEMVVHLKEKKEKNRLAAQRLRQKKGTEVAKYDKEVLQLEANVNAKRQFLNLIENNVNQLRNKIKNMFGQKTPQIKTEPINEGHSSIPDHRNSIVQNGDQNRNQKQFIKIQVKDVSNHMFCVSR